MCGSYRAIKLLEQQIKVLERVLEKRIRCQMSIDYMQFSLMLGKELLMPFSSCDKFRRGTKQGRRLCFCGFREGI